MSKLIKKLTGIILVTLLVFSSVLSFNVLRAEEDDDNSVDGQALDWEVVENDQDRVSGKLNRIEEEPDSDGKKRGSNVRVSIVLEDDSTLDNGFSSDDVSLNPGAMAYRESLRANQESMAKKISKSVLDGEKLDVVWNLTLAANIISANVPVDKIEEIRQMPGVKEVIVENEYYPEEATQGDEINMSVATQMVLSNYAWAQGYTGAGTLIAIVDTGLDIDHQSFDPYAFDMAIQDIRSKTGKDIDLLEAREVSKLWPSLNAADKVSESGREAYLNSKVPYQFNYVDSNFDVTHINDTQTEHGSHVASIAAGNKYIAEETESGIVLKNALTTVRTQGNAPDAQLLVMKVFGKGGGAYDSDYFAAIEDAIILGADTVNLSLGSASAGFSYNTTYQEIIDGLLDVNIVWANSAGNNGSWADQTYYGYLYSDDANLQTGGSPGSYESALTVASVDNKGFTGGYFNFNDDLLFYTEPSFSNKPIATIAGTHEYVYLDSVGTEAEFGELADILEGKIALCNRGMTSFFQKAEAAVKYGAIATVIVNNQPGTISMDLTDYTKTQPVVSLTQADGNIIKQNSTETQLESGIVYYTGTIEVSEGVETEIDESDYYRMSSFSSYGVPGSLTLKPEITAPGGNIYAAWGLNNTKTGLEGGKDKYENMSGTSMASPQMAGIGALLSQYIKETGLDKKAAQFGISRRALIHSLLMSTAHPIVEEESGQFYSIMKQGSGLVDVEEAMNSNIFITMDRTTVNNEVRKDISDVARDGKVKAELGDDPDRTGLYTVEFTLNNISDKDAYFDLGGKFFTQDIFEYQGNYLLDKCTADLNLTGLTWFVNGSIVMDDVPYDFNDDQDGVYDYKDAIALLDFVVRNRETIGDADKADLDKDGSITTHDALLALELANQASAIVPANGSTDIKVLVELNQEQIGEFDYNGAWVEGFLFVEEKESEDGDFGVEHTIPVLGYYGSFAEPSAIDVGNYVTLNYELEDRYPYMAVPTANGAQVMSSRAQTFIVKHTGFNVNYSLGGNPLGSSLDDGVYYPERNAVNGDNVIVGAQYSLIRNISALRYEVLNDDELVDESELVTNQYAAYFQPSEGAWKNTFASSTLNQKLNSFKEDSNVDLRLSFAPEYYVEDDEVNWENTSPDLVSSFVIDNSYPVYESVFGKRVINETVEKDEEGNERTVVSNNIVVTITASDNQYIAGAFLYDEEDNLLGEKKARDTVKKSERDTQDYVFILDGENVSDHLYVEVWDYAANVTTIEINLNKDELEEPASINLDYSYYKTAVKSSFILDAVISPWGSKDQKVVWSSSDENIATVNSSGVVTGVGAGTAIITAALSSDPTVKDECEVEVILIERELNGIIWDEEGGVFMSRINTLEIPEYHKLSEPLNLPLTATAFDGNGTLYAATFDTKQWLSSLYRIDENTFETTKVGDSRIGYMDMAIAPSLGDDILMAVYGPYVVIVDANTGDYLGVFNYSDYTGGSYLVGIAFEEQYYYSSYGTYGDWYFLLDERGKLYNAGFIKIGEKYNRFKAYEYGNFGRSCDTRYFQSLYFDGRDLYFSNYSSSESKVDLVFVNDIYDDGTIFELGSFAEDVWPVAGLYNDYVKEVTGANHDDAVLDEGAVFETNIEPLAVTSSDSKGSTNAVTDGYVMEDVKTRIDYDEEDEDVVTITLDNDYEDKVNNGLYRVEYDSDILDFSYAETDLPYYAINDDEDGVVVIAFADLKGVDTDETIASLVFDRLVMRKTPVDVTELESNDLITHDAKPEEVIVKDPTEDFGEILPEDRPEYEEDIPKGIWISALSDYEYTGKAITQSFRVYDYKKLLVEGRDYTVAYRNNKNVGVATVTVTGKGNYKDKIVETFNITPVEFNYEDTIVILNKSAFIYNNRVQKPSVSSVRHNGVILRNNTDYTVSYDNPNSKDEGLYFMTVTGKGNYDGEINDYYLISSDIIPISSLSISGIKNQTYTGDEIYQDIVIKDGKKVLVEDEDYYLIYEKNIDAGTAYVTIVCYGDYVGNVTKPFTINPVKLTANNTVVTGVPSSIKYAGDYKPQTSLTYNNEVLTENEDYKVTFTNNNKAGTATITYTGINNYSGSIKKTYKINAIDISEIRIADIPVQNYQKGGTKPDVEAYDTYNNVKLELNRDYTLSYANNTKPGTATVTFKGKGNYAGSKKLQFVITTTDISTLDGYAPDKAYVNRKNSYKSALTIKDVNGNKLVGGTDYDKNLIYTYSDGKEVSPDDIVPAGTEITVFAKAKGNYTGSKATTYRIVQADIANATASAAAQIYTGNPIELDKADITVKLNKTVLNNDDFEIVSYTNNINKGTATVTIKGVGNYGGTKTINFKIVEKSFINAFWLLFN